MGKYQDMDSAWWNEKIPMHRKIRDRDDRDKEGDGDEDSDDKDRDDR